MEGKGRGVIAARPFSSGDFLCEYAGETIGEREAKKREKEYMKDNTVGSFMYYFTHKSTKLWYVIASTFVFFVHSNSSHG